MQKLTPKLLCFLCLNFWLSQISLAQYEQFEQIEFNPDIQLIGTYKMVIDQKGMLWMNSGKGACIFDGLNSKSLTEINGLPATQVIEYLIDDIRNCVWILTVEGLAKYDGLNVETFENFNNYKIARLVLLENGNIALCGNAGVLIFDGEKVIQTIDENNGLPVDNIRDLVELSAKHWLMVSANGIIEYQNGTFKHSLKESYFRDIEKDVNGNIYITDVKNCYLYKYEQLIPIHTDDLMLSLIPDHKGKVWLNDTKQLLKLDGSEKELLPFLNIVNEEGTIGAFVFDQSGTLWVFTLEGKLFRNLKRKKTLINFDSLRLKSYLKTVTAYNGEIYIGNDNGLFRLSGSSFHQIPNLPNLDGFNFSKVLKSSNNDYWLYSNYNGIKRLGKNGASLFFQEGGLREKAILDMEEDSEGNIFAIGYFNLLQFINNEWKNIIKEKTNSNPYFRDICITENDQIWLASANGIYKFENNEIIPSKALNGKVVYKLYWKHNRLLANVNNTRIYELQIDEKKELKIIREFSPKTGYEFSSMLDFNFIDSSIVISTRKALHVFNPFKNHVLFKTWTKEDGYPDLIRGGNGKIAVKGDTAFVLAHDGIFPVNINENRSSSIPTVLIEQVEFNHKPINNDQITDNHSAYSNAGVSIKIPSKENNLRIYYTGIFHAGPRNLLFQYRMNGFDDLWSGYTKQRSVTFASLPYGEYEFEVRSISSHGTASEPAKLFIEVLTPFYSKGWVQLLALFVMLGTIYFWVKSREQRIRAKEAQQSEINNRLNKLEIKALRAKMNPHFIFNALNSIQHLIIEKDEDSALYYLNKFSKLIRKVLDKASESKIELSEEINILKNYIELEALRFDAPFNYEIYVDQSLLDEHIEIPYLLIQPFVENAIHHGLIHKDDGGQLNIKIMEEGDNIFISVEDNGIGRSASKALKGNNNDKISYGISVTKERLELMAQKAHNETFKIIDLYDNFKKPIGTRVEIKIPIIN